MFIQFLEGNISEIMDTSNASNAEKCRVCVWLRQIVMNLSVERGKSLAMGAARRRSEGGHDGGWRLRLVTVANCETADHSISSASARAAAPGSLAGLPL